MSRDRSRFRIGDIEVFPDRCIIIKDGAEISLRPLIMKLLVKLARAGGKTVSRDELLKQVWKNEDLDDNPINKAISELRDKLDDDRNKPRYIKTVHSKGYQTVAPVIFPKGYRPQRRQDRSWFNGSPYVGLAAFDAAHADVFFGRERMCEKVLKAMRDQLETGNRFVLLHGASGSGKTSLLHAGVIPRLTDPGDMHALTVAHCDLASTQPGDAMGTLAAALASWTLGDRPVFPPQPIEDLKKLLIETPESIERIIEEAFPPDSRVEKNPLAHLLLVIDHGEKLVDAASIDTSLHEQFSRALTVLCDSKRTLTTMIVRGDFYQKLQDALPDLMELKGSQGHIDVVRPSPSEIADIISDPAGCAGLDFEHDPDTDEYLDYRLCEDARGKPDVLPLLQHTLRQLYENREQENNLLTFASYREMGGLEGGIAHRAEEVFASLPTEVQASLDDVLSLLVEIQPDTGTVSGRHISYEALDANSLTLVQAFIAARLFASDNHRPIVGVAHEALLRRWPKASKWSEKNWLLLKARAELTVAAKRWDSLGRQKDHLLNPGIPLIEAMEVSRSKNAALSQIEFDLIEHSNKQRTFNSRVRRGAVAALIALSMASISMATVAMKSREDAEHRRDYAARTSALVIGDIADKIDPMADSELIKKMTGIAIEYCQGIDVELASIDELISCSRAYRKLGEVQMSQSDLEKASSNIEFSVSLSMEALSRDKTSKETLTEVGEAKSWLGTIRRRKGDIEDAISIWNEYLGHTEELVRLFGDDPESHLQKSYALTNIGLAETDRGHYEEALVFFYRSKQIKESPKAKRKEKEDEDLYELAVTSSFICNIFEKKGRLTRASSCYKEQIEAIAKLIEKNPSANEWKRQLSSLLQFHSAVELDLGRWELAQISIEKAIYQYCLLILDEPDNDDWGYYFANAHLLAGEVSRAGGDLYLAEQHYSLAEAYVSFKKEQPLSWRRLAAVAKFKISLYGKNGPDSSGMKKTTSLLNDIYASGRNNNKSRLDLAAILISNADYFCGIGDHALCASSAEESISILQDRRKIEDDARLLSIVFRAKVITKKYKEACRITFRSELSEYKNIDYLSALSKLKDSYPVNSDKACVIKHQI